MFTEILIRPIYNTMIFLYNLVGDIGITIILLTILIRILLFPLSLKGIKAQLKFQKIQPKIKLIREKYKNDLQKQSLELMKLYKEEKANPATGCLTTLIQLPILIAVYRVFRIGFDKNSFKLLYPFISKPTEITPYFFNVKFFDFSKPNYLIAILATLAQYFQIKSMSKFQPKVDVKGFSDNFTKQMNYMMIFLTLFMGITLPSGLIFYWFLTTLFSIIQQELIFKKND